MLMIILRDYGLGSKEFQKPLEKIKLYIHLDTQER